MEFCAKFPKQTIFGDESGCIESDTEKKFREKGEVVLGWVEVHVKCSGEI